MAFIGCSKANRLGLRRGLVIDPLFIKGIVKGATLERGEIQIGCPITEEIRLETAQEYVVNTHRNKGHQTMADDRSRERRRIRGNSMSKYKMLTFS